MRFVRFVLTVKELGSPMTMSVIWSTSGGGGDGGGGSDGRGEAGGGEGGGGDGGSTGGDGGGGEGGGGGDGEGDGGSATMSMPMHPVFGAHGGSCSCQSVEVPDWHGASRGVTLSQATFCSFDPRLVARHCARMLAAVNIAVSK